MNDELETLMMSLQFKFGWMLGITSWRAVASVTYGFVSAFVAKLIEGAIPEDKTWIQGLFNHRAYRIFALLFRVATSIELPKLARKPGDTTILRNTNGTETKP